jgi:hypothetical protein
VPIGRVPIAQEGGQDARSGAGRLAIPIQPAATNRRQVHGSR